MTIGTNLNELPILYYEDKIDPNIPTGLWWCKDVYDVQAKEWNAVCPQNGASWHDIGELADWVNQFPYIFVAMRKSPERDFIVEELGMRFAKPVLIPNEESFGEHKNISEMVDDFGWEKMVELMIFNAVEVPAQGILNIADVSLERKLSPKRVVSGIAPLDRTIGGFSPGTLNVWTGKCGEGKSTNVAQLVCVEGVEQGHRVCVYSGEMPKESLKMTMMQQAAGKYHVVSEVDDRTGRTIYKPQPYAQKWIDKWWNKRLFLCDIQKKGAHDEDTILRNFEYAHWNYGADIFVVDNIMTANLKGEREMGQWRAQSFFVNRLADFAKKENVCVHLVAHPRKTDGPIQNDDIGGSGDITNLANTVIKIERVPEEREEEMGCSTFLSVTKNREYGELIQIPMCYEEESRRLYVAGGDTFKEYSWVNLKAASMEGID